MMSMERYQSAFFSLFQFFFFSKRKKNTLDLSSRLDFWGDLNIVSSCFQEKGKGEKISLDLILEKMRRNLEFL